MGGVLRWGNPYSTNPELSKHDVIEVSSREKAISAYEDYLRKKIKEKDKKICAELNKIFKTLKKEDVYLVCSCKPLNCHGDIIKKIIEEKLDKAPKRVKCIESNNLTLIKNETYEVAKQDSKFYWLKGFGELKYLKKRFQIK